jgi:hypothetical protein
MWVRSGHEASLSYETEIRVIKVYMQTSTDTELNFVDDCTESLATSSVLTVSVSENAMTFPVASSCTGNEHGGCQSGS